MWAAVLKDQAHDLTRIWRAKIEEGLFDLKELFLFTFSIVSQRKILHQRKTLKKKNLLHQNAEA
jgi:hypothetical protein